MKPPRILLFGTTGQVGWELHRALQPLGHVVALSRAEADFEDPASLRQAFADRPDVVINAVAYTAVDQAEQDVDRAMRVNESAVAVLADEAARCGALLVHYSTDYVFDGASSVPYRETDAPNPRSVYGRSKLAGEHAVRASGCEHLILRTSWVYTSRGKNFLRTILRLAGERPVLRIVGDQHGAPTSARLIADTTTALVGRWLRRSNDGLVGGLYHLAASGETTWHGFASAIVAGARRLSWSPLAVESVDAIATADYPLPAPRPAYSRLDTALLCERFGLTMPDWRVGVDLCLAELSVRG